MLVYLVYLNWLTIKIKLSLFLHPFFEQLCTWAVLQSSSPWSVEKWWSEPWHFTFLLLLTAWDIFPLSIYPLSTNARLLNNSPFTIHPIQYFTLILLTTAVFSPSFVKTVAKYPLKTDPHSPSPQVRTILELK